MSLVILSPVISENGLVYQSGTKRRALWVQCPDCGPQPPLVEWLEYRQSWAVVRNEDNCADYSKMACAKCGQDAPYRKAIIPVERKQRHEKCNKRCLNGKVECHCGCEGKCHGEGVCYCKDSASTGKA